MTLKSVASVDYYILIRKYGKIVTKKNFYVKFHDEMTHFLSSKKMQSEGKVLIYTYGLNSNNTGKEL